jgi:hypothetical protein
MSAYPQHEPKLIVILSISPLIIHDNMRLCPDGRKTGQHARGGEIKSIVGSQRRRQGLRSRQLALIRQVERPEQPVRQAGFKGVQGIAGGLLHLA